MGWYFRKSLGFGPLRVNLSKSGVGYSLGVRGARIGANSRGTYIRMGRGGIYYQKYLQTKSSDPRTVKVPVPIQPQLASEPELAHVIPTANAASLQDSSATELLQEITFHHRRARIASIVIGLAAFAVGISMLASLPVWINITLVLAGVVAHVAAIRADYKRKVIHLDYTLEQDAAPAYVALLQGIEQLRSLGGLWRITSGETNSNTKYHAGAQYSIKRNRIATRLEPPRFVSVDAAVFMVDTGSQRLYFLPDRILVYEANQIGAVQYGSLVFSVEPSTFVESETVPFDAEVIGRTWRYTNKSGGPDRRFANNPQIPLVRYASVVMQSSGGLNYLIQASNMQKANLFVQAVRQYGAQLVHATQPALPS